MLDFINSLFSYDHVGGGSNENETCVLCGEDGTRPITKEQPVVLQEREVLVWQKNATTNKAEQVKKIVKRPVEMPPLPHETEKVENTDFQYLENGFVMERQFPVCNNVIKGEKMPHYCHYSCIRDYILMKDINGEPTKCPECRQNILETVLVLIREGDNYKQKNQPALEKNEKIKKFDEFNETRIREYTYNGTMLTRDEMVHLNFDEETAETVYFTKAQEYFGVCQEYFGLAVQIVFTSEKGFETYNNLFKHEILKTVPKTFKNIDDKITVKGNDIDIALFMFLEESDWETVNDKKLKEHLINKFNAISKNYEKKLNYYKQTAFWYVMAFGIGMFCKIAISSGVEKLRKMINDDKNKRSFLLWIMGVDGSYLFFTDFMVTKYIYDELLSKAQKDYFIEMYSIPLYGVSQEFALWLYSKGFVFTRFAVSKKHGRKFDDYHVSIPKLLFWYPRGYETQVDTIVDTIVRGSGIDKGVAQAIGTISYENRENDIAGTVKFEVGPFNGFDVSLKEWNVMLKKQEKVEFREERRRYEIERQRYQKREGLRISEMLFGQDSANVIDADKILKNLKNALNERNLEKYKENRFEALYGGIKFNLSTIGYKTNAWLSKLEQDSTMYYVVLFDLAFNNIITSNDIEKVSEILTFLNTVIFEKLFLTKNMTDFQTIYNNIEFDNYIRIVENIARDMYQDENWKNKFTDLLSLRDRYIDTFGKVYDLYVAVSQNDIQRYQSRVIMYSSDIIKRVKARAYYVKKDGYIVHQAMVNEINDNENYLIIFVQHILNFIFKNSSLDHFMSVVTDNTTNVNNLLKIQQAFDVLDKNQFMNLIKQHDKQKINTYKTVLQNTKKKLILLLENSV
jgi:hypothetical protein